MSHTYKILVVDDNPSSIDLVTESLNDEGYQFITAGDGSEALAKVRDESPHLVIMDVVMPRMGGYEACRIIKSNQAFGFTPIILMTAREDVGSKVEGLELGADDYLIKPVNPGELAARVKSMLRLKQATDELQQKQAELTKLNEKLKELSITDELTGLFNRRYFYNRCRYEFMRAQRFLTPITCIMLDLDHFKRVNDTYGHLFGDVVLKGIADILRESLRRVDLLARYGGEEMLIILPDTNENGGELVAERLRRAVEEAEFSDGTITVKITISLGAATFPGLEIEDYEDLIRTADEALYRAKQSGRNRVCRHEE